MKTFEEFLLQTLVKKQRKDFARANSLVKEAQNRFRFLKTISLERQNSNYIVENVYDVIRELIEARMSIDGYKSYSHEATITYLKELNFPDSEIILIDELRKIRNGIKYYGKIMDFQYALKVLNFLNKVFKRLKNLSSKNST